MTDPIIDLHTHTTASDGSLSPTRLVEAARDVGLVAVGVTDHDTIDGVAEALEAGRDFGIRVLPGVEISAEMEGGTLHVLGYGYDHTDPGINEGLNRLKKARNDRNPLIIGKLNALGVQINMAMVEERAGGGLVGRPHIAQTLVDLGTVSTVQEAFDEYLATDAKAHVHKFRLAPPDAFRMIREAGGIPVMAHPYQTKREGEDLRRLIAVLCEDGLEGIEVWYSHHTPEQVAFYSGLADEFDLVATGGTDFHGDSKPDVALGIGTGTLAVPASVLERLDERVARVRAGTATPGGAR